MISIRTLNTFALGIVLITYSTVSIGKSLGSHVYSELVIVLLCNHKNVYPGSGFRIFLLITHKSSIPWSSSLSALRKATRILLWMWTTGVALGSIRISCWAPLIATRPLHTRLKGFLLQGCGFSLSDLNQDRSSNTRMDGTHTANIPLYSQAKLTLPLGLILRPHKLSAWPCTWPFPLEVNHTTTGKWRCSQSPSLFWNLRKYQQS